MFSLVIWYQSVESTFNIMIRISDLLFSGVFWSENLPIISSSSVSSIIPLKIHVSTMVTLRRSTRRAARPSTVRQSVPSTTATSPIQANGIPIPPIPVQTSANPTDSIFPIPNPSHDFGGIQYSPYFLTNGDNPGTSLISEVLDGSNYNTWSIAMNIALDAKNKIAFVDGSLGRPLESDPHFRIWSRCNSMVKSWILNSVTKQIYGSILRFNDASEIWKDLLTRFHITNLPRSYQLTQQIWSLQQGSLDLSTYYTKLKTMWDDLDGADCAKHVKTATVADRWLLNQNTPRW